MLELTQLEALVGDDPQFMAELCRTFMASGGRLIEELRRAVAGEDRPLLKALAHKLKGGAGSVCALRVTDLSLALERTALAAAPAELVQMVDQIGAALVECAGVIQVRFP